MTGNDHVVSLGFGDTGGHRAHTDFRYQLDRNGGSRVDVFQVVNELGQVFDGVNVVVRWRRNKADAGYREAQLGDVFRHFVAGQLAAFAGLGALGHFDLDLVGTGKVFGGDAESA